MTAINIPINVRLKVNRRPGGHGQGLGTLTMKSKTPVFVMLLYASFRLFIMALKSMMGMKTY